MARMRQAREVCIERQTEERLRDLSVREVELRILASQIAGAAGWKEGQKSAAKIRLVPREQPGVEAEVDETSGLRMIPADQIGNLFG